MAVTPAGASGWRAIAEDGRGATGAIFSGDTGAVFSGVPLPGPAPRGIELPVGAADATELSAFAWPRWRAELRRDLAGALRAEAGGFDVLACARCGGRFRLLAVIEDRTVVRRVLTHLGLPTEVPRPRPPRTPPGLVSSLLPDNDPLLEIA